VDEIKDRIKDFNPFRDAVEGEEVDRLHIDPNEKATCRSLEQVAFFLAL
jgi:hypothetical protein